MILCYVDCNLVLQTDNTTSVMYQVPSSQVPIHVYLS